MPSHAKRLNIVTVTFFLALICGWRKKERKKGKQQHNTNRNAIKLLCLITRYLPIAHTVPMHRKEEMCVWALAAYEINERKWSHRTTGPKQPTTSKADGQDVQGCFRVLQPCNHNERNGRGDPQWPFSRIKGEKKMDTWSPANDINISMREEKWPSWSGMFKNVTQTKLLR